MKHWLYRYDRVEGAPDELATVLRQRVRDLLATATDDVEAETTAEGDLLVRLPARVLGLDVHKLVRMRTGVAERREARTCIPVQWHADPARHAFPTFEGTIELDPQSATTAHLAIVGAASVPLGPVGGAFDAAVLGAVANRTVRHLVERLAAALQDAVTAPSPAVVPAPASYQMRVRDVMTPDPLVLHEDMPLKTAALLLFHYGVAGAPVQTAAGGLAGVLSEADLLDAEAPLRYGAGRQVTASRRRKEARTVGEACTRPAIEITPDASVPQAAELMRDRTVARLVVVEGSDIAGVVSRHDVLRALVRTDGQTQAVLDRLLSDQDEGHVMASVDWGIAVLRGQVSTRGRIPALVTQVESIDGIVGVDADLTWEVDDVVPPVMPMV